MSDIIELKEEILRKFTSNFNQNEFVSFNIEELNPNEERTNIDFDMSLIRTNDFNSEEELALRNLFFKYKLFRIPNDKLAFTNKVKHEIQTSDNIPKQIEINLDDVILRPSQSP